ncbi:hypothetical protein ANO11243_067870 [Dothideomycetidae sp. 11243]|nr:hypothetical protein ANO11243_067870 [fungal sp. No.11243]
MSNEVKDKVEEKRRRNRLAQREFRKRSKKKSQEREDEITKLRLLLSLGTCSSASSPPDPDSVGSTGIDTPQSNGISAFDDSVVPIRDAGTPSTDLSLALVQNDPGWNFTEEFFPADLLEGRDNSAIPGGSVIDVFSPMEQDRSTRDLGRDSVEPAVEVMSNHPDWGVIEAQETIDSQNMKITPSPCLSGPAMHSEGSGSGCDFGQINNAGMNQNVNGPLGETVPRAFGAPAWPATGADHLMLDYGQQANTSVGPNFMYRARLTDRLLLVSDFIGYLARKVEDGIMPAPLAAPTQLYASRLGGGGNIWPGHDMF